MPEVVLTINNLPNALRRHFAKRVQDLQAAALDVAHRGVAEGVRLTNEEALVHTGAFKRGWTVADGPTVRNDTPYAAVLEHGRRPNRPGPPIAPIREWVRLKLGKTGPEGERIAWAIRNSIHRKGSRPRKLMFRVFQKMKPWFRAEVERRLRG